MHDVDSSHVYSNLPIGNYHRHLYQGNYNITFSCSGYHSKTINATILNNSIIVTDIQLVPVGITSVNEISNSTKKSQKFDLLGRPANKKGIKISNKKTLIIE